MIDRPLVDEILQAVTVLGAVLAAWQSRRATKVGQSNHRAINAMGRRFYDRDNCLNAIHCTCCPANDQR